MRTRNNALAEAVIAAYKTELIYGPAHSGPWKTVEDVELATLGWVYWHNTARLHGYLADLPPAEFEAAFYATQRSGQHLVEPPSKPGRFTRSKAGVFLRAVEGRLDKHLRGTLSDRLNGIVQIDAPAFPGPSG